MVARYQSACDSSCPNEWCQGSYTPSFCGSWERPSFPTRWANTLAPVTYQVAILSIITPSLLLLTDSSDGLAPWEYSQNAIGISFNWLSAKNVNPVYYPLSIVTSACNWRSSVFKSARRKHVFPMFQGVQGFPDNFLYFQYKERNSYLVFHTCWRANITLFFFMYNTVTFSLKYRLEERERQKDSQRKDLLKLQSKSGAELKNVLQLLLCQYYLTFMFNFGIG